MEDLMEEIAFELDFYRWGRGGEGNQYLQGKHHEVV